MTLDATQYKRKVIPMRFRLFRERPDGPRVFLLVLFVAAFLLVPIAQAVAFEAEIVFEGEGSGWVKGANAEEGGNPIVNCHWNGHEIDIGMPGSHECKTEVQEVAEGLFGINVKHEADSGSLFEGWKVLEGIAVTCQQENPAAGSCSVATFGSPIKIKATFALQSEPLNLTASGAPGGGFECSINGGAKGACPSEAPVGKSVKVYPTGTGVELEEWTSGPCASTEDNPCEFTMPEAPVSANAAFKVVSEELTINNVGETGTVECNINGGGFASCEGPYTYDYGTTVEVKAEAASEHVLASLTGSGSASGACSATETEGSCSFTIHATSSVTALFETSGRKDEADVNPVYGHVEQETSLTSECDEGPEGEGLNLTPGETSFLAGVEADYSNSCGLVLTSTGEETTLTASDESSIDTGHLIQEYPPNHTGANSYYLPSLLQASATEEGKGTSTGVQTMATPAVLLEFTQPIGDDATTLTFKQHIGKKDGLHTGTYEKTITLTLYQTSP
jgi:hypothetical protein